MIYVLGKTGLLGRYVYDYLRKKHDSVVGYSSKDLNLLNLSKVREFIESLTAGDWLINCAGVIPSACKTEDEYYKINSIAPHLFDLGCHRKGVMYIHPSTDCVFDGLDLIKNKPTAEDTYGLSKTIGETLHYSMVIRCSVIGEEEQGFKSYLEWVKKNRGCSVNGYTNHTWNGITCLEYAKFISKIIENKNTWVGVYPIRSTYKGCAYVNKYTLTRDLSEIYHLDIQVNEFETPTPNFKAIPGNLIKKDLYDQLIEQKKYIFT